MVRISVLGELRLAIAAVLALTIRAAAANAQDGTLRQACGADMRTVCSGIMPGGGRIKQCMADNFDKLSDGCKTALKNRQAQSGR
jgi:uncharacterized membrane protein